MCCKLICSEDLYWLLDGVEERAKGGAQEQVCGKQLHRVTLEDAGMCYKYPHSYVVLCKEERLCRWLAEGPLVAQWRKLVRSRECQRKDQCKWDCTGKRVKPSRTFSGQSFSSSTYFQIHSFCLFVSPPHLLFWFCEIGSCSVASVGLELIK